MAYHKHCKRVVIGGRRSRLEGLNRTSRDGNKDNSDRSSKARDRQYITVAVYFAPIIEIQTVNR
jgi:hypothetical protein